MWTGLVIMAMGLAMVGLVGCQTPPRPVAEFQAEWKPHVGLNRFEADLAEALANYGIGVLREGMADAGALTNYLQAIQLRPDRMDLYVRVAAVRLRRGEPVQAVAVMKDACLRNPHSPDAYIYLAQIHQALQQWEAAENACLQAMRIDPGNYKGYLQLALMYREKGDAARTITSLEDALAKVDDKRPILRLLGDLYVQRAGNVPAGKMTPDIQKAIDYYQRASREPQDELTFLYLQQLGDLYLMTRQIEGAIACFTVVTDQTPGNVQVQKKLALCYLAMGNKLKAIETLKFIANQQPMNAEIQYYLGELYEDLDDTTNAVFRFTSACESAPAISKPYLRLALLYMPTDPQKASQVLESGLKQLPKDQKILEMLAQLYLTNGQQVEAQETLHRLQEITSGYQDRALAARLMLHYGVVAQQHMLWENAVSLYRQAMTLDPALTDAYVCLSFLLLSQNRKDDAVLVMETADRMLPDDFMVNYYLGLLYNRLERYHEALDTLDQAREAAGADAGGELYLDSAFYFSYGVACERTGQWGPAEFWLQHALVLDSENIEAFNYLAYMWAEHGTNLVQALNYIGHALEKIPESGAFLDTRGWIYFQQGRYQEALDEISNALVFMPDDPTIMEHMGDVLDALHRDQEALVWWQRSYRLNPAAPGLGDKLKVRGVNTDDLRQKPALPVEP